MLLGCLRTAELLVTAVAPSSSSLWQYRCGLVEAVAHPGEVYLE